MPPYKIHHFSFRIRTANINHFHSSPRTIRVLPSLLKSIFLLLPSKKITSKFNHTKSTPKTMIRPSLLLILCLCFFYLTVSAAAHGAHHDDDGGSDPSPSPNLHSRSLILVKVWCLVLVFACTFLAGLSPCFFKWNEGFLVLGTQFAGGVFLGTSIMHFLSDSDATFHDLTDKEYPVAFMLACSGYLVTMLADCVVSYVYRKDTKGVVGPVGGETSHLIDGCRL